MIARVTMLALVALTSCAPTLRQTPMAQQEYPGILAPPNTLGPDFSVRQHLTIQAHGRNAEVDVVLQKRQNELLVIGLGPVGVRAFVLRQDGADVSFEQSFGPKMPFAPRNILVDIHRAYFMRLPSESEIGNADKTIAGELDGEHVEEKWRGGSLVERRFTRPGFKGAVTVHYSTGCTVERCEPEELTIQNEWFAYEIKIASEGYTFF